MKTAFKRLFSFILIVCMFSMTACGTKSQEKQIKADVSKYIKEIKIIDDVKDINGVVCISKQYYGKEDYTLGYVIFYSTDRNCKIAYFEDGLYKGNGENGGSAAAEEDKLVNNINTTSAAKKAIEFIDSVFPTVLLSDISMEIYFEDFNEGIIYMSITSMSSWSNGRYNAIN